MSSQLSAHAITAHTAITRMSISRCSTLPEHRGSSSAEKCSTSFSTDIATLPSLTKGEPKRQSDRQNPASPFHASPLGSTNFTGEQGRDALLVAVARIVPILAEGRRNLAEQNYDRAARDLRALTDQCGRLAKLAAFLERSGEESLRAYAEGRPAGPLDPFNVQGQSRDNA